MRDVAIAALALLVLGIGALAPAAWQAASRTGALASGAPPTPRATPSPSSTPAAVPQTFAAPRELSLPSPCRVLATSEHQDGKGAAWTVQCASARANLDVSVAAMRQGWTHLEGPPIGVGMQNYSKGELTMQVAYRLDGPGFADPFQLIQYWRPFSAGSPGRASPFAYLRAPTGFDLPRECAWDNAPVGFTEEGAYKIPFACSGIEAGAIMSSITRSLEAQGWKTGTGEFGMLTFAKNDLRLTVGFADSKDPSATPWVVEALCCFGP